MNKNEKSLLVLHKVSMRNRFYFFFDAMFGIYE